MYTNAQLIAILAKAEAGAPAAETIAAHVTAQTAGVAQGGLVPPFVAKALCFALKLLRSVVKLNGEQSAAADVLQALACGE